ncbi:hypothetical protein A3D78_06835 [Candidatus Gottesmanbacteria bacterium RIFCSPHIGHO2_02_FULL_39_14]|uniref:Glycosyltransferase 2-like domain-containing protein n=1 Tax=Candidatus Gottesmanbacteria bacterium RIFCSPHIGHO2_02_FULL_39_14 TaxID=1798383 RepID=A0A1F5ZV23_9BACT|nr:MAG: hypothetical protein A3D78_06835 [Candidatus Gottesmanbacteria bacterium RIFCSPHIGHO2_02_FULL_39_14]
MENVNLLIGIPAYNEAKILGRVLKSLPRKIPGIANINVLVVDDGSTDGTAKVAESAGIIVARHLVNRGLGGALKTVFAYARKNNFDFLVTMDADGQHDSQDLTRILTPLINKRNDVVIGSRWLKPNSAPFSRRFMNKLANYVTLIFFGISTTDSQSGFRAFNKKSIAAVNLQTDGMEVSSEIFREIISHKLSVREVPIKAIYTDYSKKKGQSLANAPNVLIQLLLRLLR